MGAESQPSVGVGYAPNGKHDLGTALQLVPGIIKWLGPVLAPYSPTLNCPGMIPACATCPSDVCPAPCPTCTSPAATAPHVPTQLPDHIPTSARK